MKEKETLEEVAQKYYPEYPDGVVTSEIYAMREGFVKGCKVQQEQDKKMYSEEEVLDLLVGILDANKCFVTFIGIKEWFEQNKNK